MIFDYPDRRNNRRHGPAGYSSYKSYLSWLRDEFTFRCVYCLRRENWGQVTGEFEIDHFRTQKLSPELATEYANLFYACRRCNAVKSDQTIDNPFEIMVSGRIETRPDGTLQGLDNEAWRLIDSLDLNSPRLIRWRFMWLRSVELAGEKSDKQWQVMVGFPSDLPDLRRLRPPLGNSRPEGVAESWAALAERGELPEHY